MEVKKRRKFTGSCELKYVVEDSYKPLLRNCGKPARYYTADEVGMFGLYMCDECCERR